MLLDLPRVEYNDKEKIKKSDMELVKERNRKISEKGGKKAMTLAEMKEKKEGA